MLGRSPRRVVSGACAGEEATAPAVSAGELEAALDGGEIHFVFQPTVDLVEHRVIGYETLARWRLANGSVVSPKDFVSLAESSGLICQLRARALDAAIAEAQQLRRTVADAAPFIAVNLSAHDLSDPTLIPDIVERLRCAGLPPDAIVFELTEMARVLDEQSAAGAIAALRLLGCAVGLDDFGIGYSSLDYLRRVPLDFVKIDVSFVASIADDERSRVVVAEICHLAARLDCATIAEGIENESQASALIELGCHLGQGHLFGQPATHPEPPTGGAPEAVAVRSPACRLRPATAVVLLLAALGIGLGASNLSGGPTAKTSTVLLQDGPYTCWKTTSDPLAPVGVANQQGVTTGHVETCSESVDVLRAYHPAHG